jgi:GTP-binding protein HflX
MQYEIPLLRDWIHKARYSEKPGFMAGGEYEVAQYYEISRKRIKKIKEKLKKVEIERDIRRKQRRNLGYFLISVVGYTNAGKSTLFNLIADEEVTVENRLFSTLSTTTRKVPQLKKPALLTDTVGLIDNLPHWIIDAFHSTLEEIFLSDVILLVLDISEPVSEIKRKLDTSFSVLLPDINPSNIILIFNKIDKLEGIENDIRDSIIDEIELDHSINDIIFMSAVDKKYKAPILEPLIKRLKFSNQLSIHLPNISETPPFVNWLYDNCEIISIEYDDQIKIQLRYRDKDKGHITKNNNRLKGSIFENSDQILGK